MVSSMFEKQLDPFLSDAEQGVLKGIRLAESKPEPEPPPPTTYAEAIRQYMRSHVTLARRRGDDTISFRSGDIHAALGLKNQLANVCQVMKRKLFAEAAGVEALRIVASPPSGQGANLVIEYRIL